MGRKPKVVSLTAAPLVVAPPEIGPVHLWFQTLCLTTWYRDIVKAALPEGAVASNMFWSDLEMAVTLYIIAQRRPTWRSHREEFARWARIDQLAVSLWRELKDEPSGADGMAWLRKMQRQAADRAAYFEVVSKAAAKFRHPHREAFYAALIGLWHFHLRLPVRFSAKRRQYAVHGPLVAFIAACSAPLLGKDAPTPHTIAAIIKRHRQRPFVPWSLITQASDTHDVA